MTNIKFKNSAHQTFYTVMLNRCKVNDECHRAFFYVMGISDDTRRMIDKMFDFKTDRITPDGMYGGWQTSGTLKVCRLAFNLWNNYTEEGEERRYTPEDLFCCGYAPYFVEGIRLRYPSYL